VKLNKNRIFIISLQNRPKELGYLKDGRDKQPDSRISKNKHLGLLTKQALNENTHFMTPLLTNDLKLQYLSYFFVVVITIQLIKTVC